MNGPELLRIVDAIHRDKSIDKEIVFEGIEQAILSAARKLFGEDHEIEVRVDRGHGNPTVKMDGNEIEPDALGDLLGRISAQTAKQVMIQKIREGKGDFGYNARNEQYEDLFIAGVIDPTKVCRVALENASSIAGMLLTTECVISDIKEENSMPQMPGGGMGGMM